MDNKIVVAGAGSIGCFVGGLLAWGGRQVALLGRQRIVGSITRNGLRLTDLEGLDVTLAPDAVVAGVDPSMLATGSTILVTVKSSATEDMAKLIAAHASSEAVIVSLQNGVENADVLRRLLPGRRVVSGMVPFNVVQSDDGRFHRGTGGEIVIEAGLPGLADLMTVPALPIRADDDLEGVLWGKLLLNLNNALNALSGRPLREQLADRRWRRLLADQQAEALSLLNDAGITPRAIGRVPVRLMPHILRLPSPIFEFISARNLRIDPQARSSMWEDLEKGRRTEIDVLQGAILRLADRLGGRAPCNARVVELVRAAEAAGRGSPRLDPITAMPERTRRISKP